MRENSEIIATAKWATIEGEGKTRGNPADQSEVGIKLDGGRAGGRKGRWVGRQRRGGGRQADGGE